LSEKGISSAIGGDGHRVSRQDLLGWDDLRLSDVRIASFKHAKSGGGFTYRCPECRHGVWPRRKPIGWVHFSDGPVCMLRGDRRMSKKDLDAAIHIGLQEGPEHKRLVNFIAEMARCDPHVEDGSILVDEYVRHRTGAAFGRYPDVYFNSRFGPVAVEVQLKGISLHRIVDRMRFYLNNGIRLLWVTAEFDADLYQSWRWDIVAAQEGVILSVDHDQIVGKDVSQGLQFTQYRLGRADRSVQQTRVGLEDLFPSSQRDQFIERWCEVAQKGYMYCEPLVGELYDTLELDKSKLGNRARYDLARIISSFIATDLNMTVGYNYPTVDQQVNKLLENDGSRQVCAIYGAFFRWRRPHSAHEEIDQKITKYILRAEQNLEQEGKLAWPLSGNLGRVLGYLFPEWPGVGH
jgi:hypothetical protein